MVSMSKDELDQQGSGAARGSLDAVLITFVLAVIAAVALGASGIL